jgi:hypothetical protein
MSVKPKIGDRFVWSQDRMTVVAVTEDVVAVRKPGERVLQTYRLDYFQQMAVRVAKGGPT